MACVCWSEQLTCRHGKHHLGVFCHQITCVDSIKQPEEDGSKPSMTEDFLEIARKQTISGPDTGTAASDFHKYVIVQIFHKTCYYFE
jgi:hypothetical protein